MDKDALPIDTPEQGHPRSSILSEEAVRSIPPIADWFIYACIAFCSIAQALFGAYRMDADPPAYLDLSDAIRSGAWHSAFNAYWFPFYPALLAAARASFGFRMQYELMAARLLDALLGLVFVAAAVILAASARRLMLARGVRVDELLPARTLALWVAVVAWFFVSLDLTNIKPDTLVSIFMILAVAALFRALTEDSVAPYIAAGLCGALAFWAKSFALPFFLLWILLAALFHLRDLKILSRLALAFFVFAALSAPLIWQISSSQGRFTFGTSGSLNLAWFVNRADRFNPVADQAAWQPGSATGTLNHPGELLAKSPSISYYGRPHSLASTPQWDDPSYWFDGLNPRMVLSQFLAEIKVNLRVLGSLAVMRFQVVALAALLGFWGFRMRRSSFAHPVVIMALIQALACIGLYVAVDLEPRYIAFAFVIVATVYAACSLTPAPGADRRSLHAAVLIAAALLLLFGLQDTLRESKSGLAEGAQPLRGIYSMPTVSAASELARLYPPGTEVACMGDAACWLEPYWPRYAGLRMTAIVETGNGVTAKSAEEGCSKLAQNPAALDALRKKNVRAVVTRFDGTQPCSSEWRPLGTSPNFFYLPL